MTKNQPLKMLPSLILLKQSYCTMLRKMERDFATVMREDVLFCSLAFLDPRVGHTVDVLSPFISILCHSD